jgi:transcriptional regulator with XRE-family HTH domain
MSGRAGVGNELVEPLATRSLGMFGGIGATLAIIRKERGFSQEALAKRCRMGRSQVSRYESGKDLMTFSTLEKLLRFLAVEPEGFFRLAASLTSSTSPADGPGEAELRHVNEAVENLHAAIDQFQEAIEGLLPAGVRAALLRLRASAAAGSPTPGQIDQTATAV